MGFNIKSKGSKFENIDVFASIPKGSTFNLDEEGNEYKDIGKMFEERDTPAPPDVQKLRDALPGDVPSGVVVDGLRAVNHAGNDTAAQNKALSETKLWGYIKDLGPDVIAAAIKVGVKLIPGS